MRRFSITPALTLLIASTQMLGANAAGAAAEEPEREDRIATPKPDYH